MEAVVVIAIIAVLIVLLGVSLLYVAKAMLIGSAVVLGLMFVFFSVMTVLLLLSKKAKGRFDGFEKKEGRSFETAWYSIGGERLPNIFPAENVLRSKIYQDGEHKMRRLKLGSREFAIDGHSIIIILLGLWLTTISMALVIFVMSIE
ncbi:hypothetical protein SAMN02910447_00961 [Ruminococcus sp. YE71]|uniref:hypothetical protein n=1 Tax=unclassified Ruminococcus TaxID=2608920 RepID=UPI000881E36B|nr:MULTISPECIES: hypothetical protein [unclassified Ruminococcus]SDA15608.1 hypothetical protein SAMN02910446_00960 [Ruminococcus sp. YE78]SFW22865.1 hypothetical protein SAMN02910447_00961 [Ruminococcus sp. YE71]